jgi:hypothetical protein
MGGEDRFENHYQGRYRSLMEILQRPVRDTVRSKILADLETYSFPAI